MSKALSGWMGLIVGLPIFAFFIVWRISANSEPIIADFICEFAAHAGQAPVKLGSYTSPLRILRVDGAVTGEAGKRSGHAKARAEYEIDGQKLAANVSGTVFTEAETIDGLFINIEDSNFGRRGLFVVTLNDEGHLDSHTERAYLYTSNSTITAHPMKMECETSPRVQPGFLEILGV